ncbi:MAG: DUF11 domain-containing protein, partial [Pirellulales bacterium]|nr:DUF11 domain-containing protein [Pirellulales bacterium]
QLRWTLGRLEPRQTASMDVDLRALRSGTLSSCAEAVASGGIRARDCVTTVVGTADLAVRIQGPTSAAVGDQVSYEIIVENHGEAAATGLLIKDRFDEGLEYPGARSPLEKELDNLPPGQSMGIGITFRTTRAGNLCHTVEVTGDGGARASAQACVNVTEAARPAAPSTGATSQGGRAAVTVEKVGPATAEVGQPALFTILVRNTGDVTLTNVRIVDSPDAALVGGRATEGGQMGDDGSVTWTYPSLPIGAVARLQIECRCDRAVAEAVNRVSVTSDQGAQDKAEARVAVQTARPSPLLPPSDGSTAPGLSLSVVDLTDSVGVGRTLTYEIVVKNVSPSPDEDVTLEVEVPPGMSTIDAQIVGLGGVRHKVYGQTIVFDPVETIRAGDQIRYTVKTQANTPGKMTLHARVRSRRLPTGLTGKQDTDILAGP